MHYILCLTVITPSLGLCTRVPSAGQNPTEAFCIVNLDIYLIIWVEMTMCAGKGAFHMHVSLLCVSERFFLRICRFYCSSVTTAFLHLQSPHSVNIFHMDNLISMRHAILAQLILDKYSNVKACVLPARASIRLLVQSVPG